MGASGMNTARTAVPRIKVSSEMSHNPAVNLAAIGRDTRPLGSGRCG